VIPVGERDAGADPEWVAQQVSKFSPDDLRRAARVLVSIAADGRAASGDVA
jgi:hypothetical protein